MDNRVTVQDMLEFCQKMIAEGKGDYTFNMDGYFEIDFTVEDFRHSVRLWQVIGMTNKTFGLLLIVLAFLIGYIALNSEGCKREMKSVSSDLGGGVMRTVTAYDYNGKPIKTWKGKFDISERQGETYFDLNGKRVIIQRAIVISEEQ